MLRTGALLGGVLCAALSGAAHAANGDAREYKLENGMKLIVKEDHRAPVAVSQVWYKVGASYEHDGVTGLSHVLEHMMFKGTKKHPAGEFSRIIAENGGKENAFTGADYTAYFQTLEKSRLPVSFELEADRMRNLSLPEEEFQKELNVVMEERRMRTEDNPQSLTYEQFKATAFINSPYRIPTIGWMDDLEAMEVDDLREWYRRWYAPNNATLVVVGDVEPKAVLKLAKKYFGKLKPSDLTPVKPRHEVRQRGEKRIIVAAPAELPYLLMGYKVPVSSTAEASWEPYALDVLANLLDGGNSARLASRLTRGKAIAAEAGAGYSYNDRMTSLFLLNGTPARGHGIEELEKALRDEVEDLRNNLVSASELKRVKAQIKAARVYELDSIFYQAMQIGQLETVGIGWHEVDRYPEHINAVTAEQLREVARKYLKPERLTVAELEPLPIDPDHPPRHGGATSGALH
jgi:zinc protease